MTKLTIEVPLHLASLHMNLLVLNLIIRTTLVKIEAFNSVELAINLMVMELLQITRFLAHRAENALHLNLAQTLSYSFMCRFNLHIEAPYWAGYNLI